MTEIADAAHHVSKDEVCLEPQVKIYDPSEHFEVGDEVFHPNYESQGIVVENLQPGPDCPYFRVRIAWKEGSHLAQRTQKLRSRGIESLWMVNGEGGGL